MQRELTGRIGIFTAAALCAVGAGSAVAAPRAAAPLAKLSAPLIAAPKGDAHITHGSVRVVVNRRPGAKTRIRLGRRNVTARFRVVGRQLVAVLNRKDGVRAGRNHLAVVATRSGKPEERLARSFFVLRRSSVFVNVRVLGRNPARLRINIVSGGSQLELAQRPRTVRVLLNGRSVTRELITRTHTQHTVTLSASHGLRFGVNHLRVAVAEPFAGRYASVSRRFTVRRDRPLAAAGLDRQARPNVRVRLGGVARAARAGRLSYRWTLVSRPPGSTARISGSTRAHPSLVPDRPGRYVARVRVSERRAGRASSAQLGSASVDDTSIDTAPTSALMRVAANANGIQIGEPGQGGAFYTNPNPASQIQLLMLNRLSLQPTGLKNTNFGPPGIGLKPLHDWLDENGAANQLVVLRIPPGSLEKVVADVQREEFNEVLERLGVHPFSEAVFAEQNHQLLVVGIPFGGKGSGWVARHAPTPAPLGFLMPDADATQGYRYQPREFSFDTRAESTATTNTMDVGGQKVTSTPMSYRFAVHYVELDAGELRVLDNRSIPLNGVGITALTDLINKARAAGHLIALQSIGAWNPCDTGGCGEAALRDALITMGANPHYFNTLASSYAFVGGAQLGTTGSVQSNASIVADAHAANGPVNQVGTLSGRLRMRPDGYFAPSLDPPKIGTFDSLYDVIFNTVEQPWPYTKGPDAGAYGKALAYISGKLSDKTINPSAQDFSDYSTDVRGAYLGMPEYALWNDVKAALLDKIHYPNAAAGSCQSPPDDPANAPGFTIKQFCELKSALQDEFSALQTIRTFLDTTGDALTRAGDKDKGQLRTIGDELVESVEPSNVDVADPFFGFLRTIAEAAEGFKAQGAFALAVAAAFAQDLLEISNAVGEANGKPVGEQLTAKVDDLAAGISDSVARAKDALDAIRAVAVSDPARLQAFGNLARAQQKAPYNPALISNQLAAAGARYFSSTLVRSLLDTGLTTNSDDWQAFRYYYQGKNPTTPAECRYKLRNAPDGAWVPFMWDRGQWSSLIIANVGIINSTYPSSVVLDQMFMSPSRQSEELGPGYGIEKTQWFWESLKPLARSGRFDDCTL